MAQAFSYPGIDPREHIVNALVCNSTAAAPAVEFDTDHGQVYVNVILQPSKVPVRARVAAGVAGNGEGDYFPFLYNDEVLVALPNGNERAGAVIIGRLNNKFNAFPFLVAGQDVTQNNFAFQRIRTPYILETASSYMVRSATTKAFWSIDTAGTLTFADGNSNMLHVGADFIGMSSGDNTVMMQLDLHNTQVTATAGESKICLDAAHSYWINAGDLQIGTNGATPGGHVATVEGVVNMIVSFFSAFGALLTASSSPTLTSSAIGALVTAYAETPLATAALLLTAAGATTPPALIAAALASGSASTIGCPGLVVG